MYESAVYTRLANSSHAVILSAAKDLRLFFVTSALAVTRPVDLRYLGMAVIGDLPSLREAIAVAISPSIAAGIKTIRTARLAQRDTLHIATMLHEIMALNLGHMNVIRDAGTSTKHAHKTTITAPVLKSWTGSAPKAIVIVDIQLAPRATMSPMSTKTILPVLFAVVTIGKLAILASKSNKIEQWAAVLSE